MVKNNPSYIIRDSFNVMQAALTTTVHEIDLFNESIRSPATKVAYRQSLRQFESETGYKLSREATDGKSLQAALIAYVVRLKHKGTSYARIAGIVAAVRKYCEIYDVEINYRKVQNVLPEHIKTVKDRIYTKAEIRILLDAASLRVRALILLLVSTGARSGAIPDLKLRDVIGKTDGRYKVALYAGAVGDEVMTFLTLEASQALERYLRAREAEGEILRPESPVIRKEFSVSAANKLEPLRRRAITSMLMEVAFRTKIRQKSGGKRQDVMLVHSFRKFNNTALVRAGVKPVVCELLLGHNVGMQFNYLRLSEDEIYHEFLKAEKELMISEEPALRQEVENLKIANADLGLLKATVVKQSEDLAILQRVLEKYAKGEISPLQRRSPEEDSEYLAWLAEQKEREG